MNRKSVKTLQDLVRESAGEYGGRIYLREKNGDKINDTSFSTFYRNTLRVSSFIKKLSSGSVVHAGIVGLKSSAYITCYFGVTNSGNVIVPLDAQLSPEDLTDNLNRSDSSVLFFDKRFMPVIDEIKKNCTSVGTYICLQDNDNGYTSFSDIISEYKETEEESISHTLCASIVYTSGTTGKSKGVMLSHANLIDNTMCEDNESTPDDSLLSVLPVHHVYCLTCDILLSLRYGSTVCINDSIMRIPQNLKLFQPTTMLLVPMIAETIYKKIRAAHEANPEVPVHTIARSVFGERMKIIYSGGAYLSPETAKAFIDMGVPIAQGYGMTECSPRISTGSLKNITVGDVGKIVNGCEVKIVEGEIWAKSPSVMMGYYKDKQATDEVITEDGWLKTGDLGYVKDNRIYITGRKKNLIILSNGENVSPEEIENKFAGVEWVSEILVYDDNGVITAEIFPDPEFKGDVETSFREHAKNINRTLSSAKSVRKLRIRDCEFEKTTSKKIKRNQTGIKGREI